jgi:hypothetical protein
LLLEPCQAQRAVQAVIHVVPEADDNAITRRVTDLPQRHSTDAFVRDEPVEERGVRRVRETALMQRLEQPRASAGPQDCVRCFGPPIVVHGVRT